MHTTCKIILSCHGISPCKRTSTRLRAAAGDAEQRSTWHGFPAQELTMQTQTEPKINDQCSVHNTHRVTITTYFSADHVGSVVSQVFHRGCKVQLFGSYICTRKESEENCKRSL